MGTIASLDMLQNSGIIPFDAEAYIKGEPQHNINIKQIQPQTSLAKKQLEKDIYEATGKNNGHPATWKKWAAAVLAIGLIAFVSLRGKLNPKNWKIFNKTV